MQTLGKEPIKSLKPFRKLIRNILLNKTVEEATEILKPYGMALVVASEDGFVMNQKAKGRLEGNKGKHGRYCEWRVNVALDAELVSHAVIG